MKKLIVLASVQSLGTSMQQELANHHFGLQIQLAESAAILAKVLLVPQLHALDLGSRSIVVSITDFEVYATSYIMLPACETPCTCSDSCIA